MALTLPSPMRPLPSLLRDRGVEFWDLGFGVEDLRVEFWVWGLRIYE